MATPGLSLIIRSVNQTAELVDSGRSLKTYKISTAKNGLGCVDGSYCTPTGPLRIAQKIGAGLPTGAVLRGRVPTGEVWNTEVNNPLAQSTEDLILSRILWLEGAHETNRNTLDRYIYLHGTNFEQNLGQPVSHGCIRFSNSDIIELFDLLPVGSTVEVS